MTFASNPPFRAEHIGSLLRPQELQDAYRKHAAGEIDDAALEAIEDRHIRDAVRLQEEVGLRCITDGEFRRTVYWGHFPKAVSGFTEMEAALQFGDGSGQQLTYTTAIVNGKLRREKGIATEEYRFVRPITYGMPKVTLPSPCSQHYFRWREGISEKAYPDLDEFYSDVARIYREELLDLSDLGAEYVQFDAVSLPLLCDPKLREQVKQRGYDPDQLVDAYIAVDNAALEDRPRGMTVGMHLCRGNNQGKWLGEGGYEHLAEKMFNKLAIDAFFLEYDTPRAGSFEPLRFMPADKVVVLGLISSKTPVLESADELRRRIDEAAAYVPLERLCLSPQCGFASNAPGNPLSFDDQRRKLELVVSVARSVWGDV